MDYPYIDMHCDTLYRIFSCDRSSFYGGEGHQSLRRMCDAGQTAQFFAIFFPPRHERPDYMDDGTKPLPPDEEFFEELRSGLLQTISEHPREAALAHNAAEIALHQAQGRSSAILTLEDGRMVNGCMETLHDLYARDVRAIALTWNYSNCFGSPNSRDPRTMDRGLTDFGKEAIGEMNRLGMLVDVSHLSDGGFWDVMDITRRPIIASHSNCRALTDHTRNLTDDMIRALAENGGVSGLNLCSAFLHPDPTSEDSRIEDMVRHCLHFLDVGGEDILGLGSDFDGIGGNLEIGHPEEMDRLFFALKKKGVSERQLDKIARGNVMRVIEESMR